MEQFQALADAIGTAVGVIVALGGIVGALTRTTRVARLRRQMTVSAKMVEEVPKDQRAVFEALHREDAARYLALVQGRASKVLWAIPLAIGIGVLAVVIIALAAASVGAGAAAFGELATLLIAFAFLGFVAVGYALKESATDHQAYISAYRVHAQLDPVKNPLSAAERNVLVSAATVGVLAFAALGGYVAGAGAAAGDPGASGAVPGAQMRSWLTMALVVPLGIAIVTTGFLFPRVARGEVLTTHISGNAANTPGDAQSDQEGAGDSSGETAPADSSTPPGTTSQDA